MKFSVDSLFIKWTLFTVFISIFSEYQSFCQEDDSKDVKVAILPFRNSTNLSGVDQFTDSLKFILQKQFSFKLINDEELFNALKKRGLDKKDPMDDEFAYAAGRFVKADFLINGELKFINESFDFIIHFRDLNQKKVMFTFHLIKKNKQELFQELMKSIPEDLAKNFTTSARSIGSLIQKSGSKEIQQKAEKIENREEMDKKTTKTDAGQTMSNDNTACNEQLYNKIINYFKLSEFSKAFLETRTVLSLYKNDNCIVQTLNKAYSNAASQLIVQKNNYSAYLILDSGVMLLQTWELKKELATICHYAANEICYNICIKKYPSEFASSITYVKKNDLLTRCKGDISHLNGWYMVYTDPQVSDTTSIGYIKATCVRTTDNNKLIVVDKDKRNDVERLFNLAMELDPSLKWQILIDQNRHQLIIITVIVIIILIILLRAIPKPVKKSGFQQRLEKMANERGYR